MTACPFTEVGSGAPVRVGGESSSVGALPLVNAWKDGVEKPASVRATEFEMPPGLS